MYRRPVFLAKTTISYKAIIFIHAYRRPVYLAKTTISYEAIIFILVNTSDSAVVDSAIVMEVFNLMAPSALIVAQIGHGQYRMIISR